MNTDRLSPNLSGLLAALPWSDARLVGENTQLERFLRFGADQYCPLQVAAGCADHYVNRAVSLCGLFPAETDSVISAADGTGYFGGYYPAGVLLALRRSMVASAHLGAWTPVDLSYTAEGGIQ